MFRKGIMQKVIFTIGLPASGKSTWSKDFAEKHINYVRVNRDDLRNMRGKYWLPKQEDLITVWERDCICSALYEGYNVIVDATNLNQKFMEQTKAHILATGVEVKFEYQDFTHVPLEECIKNDLKRPNSVGEKVIRKFYNNFLRPKYDVIRDDTLPKALIVDLDGTLAIHNGRSPYEESKCDTDLVNKVIQGIIFNYYGFGYQIIFVSGRRDKVELKTRPWLLDKVNFSTFLLYMRKTGDERNDSIVKREIFMEHINGKYNVEFILDDRSRVIDMWRN